MRSLDKVVLGEEPTFTDGGSRIQFMNAYNWYSYMCDVESSRKWILDYMKAKKYSSEDIIRFERIKDGDISLTMCSTARMVLRGAVLDYDLDRKLREMIDTYTTKDCVERKRTVPENSLITSIDTELDKFYGNKYVGVYDVNEQIKQSSPTNIKGAIVYYKQLLDELQAVNTDSDVKEAYDHLTRKQYTNYVAVVESIIGNLTQNRVNNKRNIVRKPRHKKQKSAVEKTKKVKYLQQDTELNVVSIQPDKVIAASVVWIYNTKTKKLARYQALAGMTLSIKGTTLINYDQKTSVQKTIRKPKQYIPLVTTEARAPLTKSFEKIRAKPTVANGRLNKYTLILRVIK